MDQAPPAAREGDGENASSPPTDTCGSALARNLRAIMARAGIGSAAALAARSRFSRRQIGDWLEGRRVPRDLDALAAALGCHVGALLAPPANDAETPAPARPATRYSMAFDDVANYLAARLGMRGEVFVFLDRRLFPRRPDARDVIALVSRVRCRVNFLLPFEDFLASAPGGGWAPRDVAVQARERAPALAQRMRTMPIDTRGLRVGLSAGALLFAFDRKRRDPLATFQHVRCTAGVAGEEIGDRWMKVQVREASELWSRIRTAVLPLDVPDLGANGIVSGVREPRLESFPVVATHYGELLELAALDTAGHEVLARRLGFADGSTVEVLDVGPGSLVLSSQALLDPLVKRSVQIDVLGVDPVPPHELSCLWRNHRPRLVRSRFEDFYTDQRFGIGMAIHSWYTIDVEQLARLYALVKPGGYIVILQGNRGDNVMSLFTEAVDRWLAERRGNDPAAQHRVYAEDIEAWLVRHGLLPQREGSTICSTPVDVRTLFDGTHLTTRGTAIVDYLLGGTSREAWSRSTQAAELRASLDERLRAGVPVSHTQTLFVIERDADQVEELLFRPADGSSAGDVPGESGGSHLVEM